MWMIQPRPVFHHKLDRNKFEDILDPKVPMINVGTGQDCTIADLARTIADVVGYQGNIVFDTRKSDGTPRKLLDVRRLTQLGWKPQIDLKEGLYRTYKWFLKNKETAPG